MAGWNFRKRKTIVPGVNLNFSKKGITTSVGPKGAKVSLGPNGTYLNTSIPGTGLYRRQKIGNDYTNSNGKNKNGCLRSIVWGILIFHLLGGIGIVLDMNDSKDDNETKVETEIKTEDSKDKKEDILVLTMVGAICIICVGALIKMRNSSKK